MVKFEGKLYDKFRARMDAAIRRFAQENAMPLEMHGLSLFEFFEQGKRIEVKIVLREKITEAAE